MHLARPYSSPIQRQHLPSSHCADGHGCKCLPVCLAARSSSARPQSGGQHHGQLVAIPSRSLPATAATAPALMLRMHAQQAHIRTHPRLLAWFSGRASRTAAVAQWLCGGQTHTPSSVAALRSKECALRSELTAVARTHHVRMLGAGEDDIWVCPCWRGGVARGRRRGRKRPLRRKRAHMEGMHPSDGSLHLGHLHMPFSCRSPEKLPGHESRPRESMAEWAGERRATRLSRACHPLQF